MRFTIAILGTEVFTLDLSRPDKTVEDSEHTVAHRHAGDFGFGSSPSRPYWTSEPGESPAVARLT